MFLEIDIKFCKIELFKFLFKRVILLFKILTEKKNFLINKFKI